MRFRALRFLTPALVASLPTAPLVAEDAVTRLTPVPLVSFRSGSAGHDLSLRDAPPASRPTATTSTRPTATTSIVRPRSSGKTPPKTAPKVAMRTKPAPRPAPQTVVRTVPPLPAPPRSVLPPYAEPPPGALPPGGRDLALQPTTFTPYDRYLGSVRTVISNLEIREPGMLLVARMMKEGRRFRYCVCDPYRADPPSLTEARRAGDCKSKALWLYDNLGDSNALFVIGKTEKRARTSHAWVYWRYDDRWWILDCTEQSNPIAADSVSSDRYVPYYSFGKSGAYRHKATRLILTGALHPSAKPVTGLR